MKTVSLLKVTFQEAFFMSTISTSSWIEKEFSSAIKTKTHTGKDVGNRKP